MKEDINIVKHKARCISILFIKRVRSKGKKRDLPLILTEMTFLYGTNIRKKRFSLSILACVSKYNQFCKNKGMSVVGSPHVGERSCNDLGI